MQVRDWLRQTRVSEIMVRNVVTLAPDAALADAAALFLVEQISGAPVVDQAGACLGVLSASDVLRAEEAVAAEQRKVAESNFWNSGLALPVSVYEQKLAEVRDRIAPVAQQPVSRFMTTNLVSVRDDTPLATVVENMVFAHIHRVLVLDANQRLLGIISTIDVLAALLRAGRGGEAS